MKKVLVVILAIGFMAAFTACQTQHIVLTMVK